MMSGVSIGERSGQVVGRDAQLARLDDWLGCLWEGQRSTVLVSGEAGIGKTTLIRETASRAANRGARVVWGTSVDGDGVPGFWPWTQALNELVLGIGVQPSAEAAGEDLSLLSSIVPRLGGEPRAETSARDRLLLMDAVDRFLTMIAATEPLLVVLDDLHWADESSVEMLEFLTRSPRLGPMALVVAFRREELGPGVKARIVEMTSRVDHLELSGLDPSAVASLVGRLLGESTDPSQLAEIHERTGGHPFFVRELALLAGEADSSYVPTAVREAIDRRIERLPAGTVRALEGLALLGGPLLPDVIAAALDASIVDVEGSLEAAEDAGVLIRQGGRLMFAHDLLRETVAGRVTGTRRTELHQALGSALEARYERSGDVAAADVARHFVAAASLVGSDRAARWAMEAARADLGTLAFSEAADHLRRFRAAIADAAVPLGDSQMVDVLLAEAGARSRAGHSVEARGLLHHAADLADRGGTPVQIAEVALAAAALGAQFATRRDATVQQLDRARRLVEGVDDVMEARVAATLARELQHSIAEDRPRAGPLSEHALEVGRRAGDDATLLACLLARHDVLWTPGEGARREEVAREIVSVAQALGDEERQAEGLVLLANALLEQGSAAYEAPLESGLAILNSLGQPHHRYMAATRRACLSLLRGRLDEADELIEEATRIGHRIREPDTGNVRMSQRLELVRSRRDPDELREFAAQAVEHWTGAPVHAHSVAAGFSARAGDLEAASRHVAAVVDLGTWRVDRSYLWSVFVRELAQAAIATDNRSLAGELFEDLVPLAHTCGVNGAVVAFAGSHSHTAGLLAAALGDGPTSLALLSDAADAYRRLGATGWLDELESGSPTPPPTSSAASARLRRDGPLWRVSFAGKEVTVPDSKGWQDIARLLASPDTDVHVLDLMGGADRSRSAGEILDRRALAAYRQRMTDLDEDIAAAEENNDFERRSRAEAERQALLDELGSVSGLGGRSRTFANHPAERARKAVSGRIRDAIRKLRPSSAGLADHLETAIVTGTYCRYRSDGTQWQIDQQP